MSRVRLLLMTLPCLLAVSPSGFTLPDFRLAIVPTMVYKVDDPGNSASSSFSFEIAVVCSADCALTPVSADVELSSEGLVVERQHWTAGMLGKISRVSHRILPSTPAWSPVHLFTLPEAFDLRLYFRCPQA